MLEKNCEVSVDFYPVVVDYGMSIGDMVKAGKYDWSNESINNNTFPVYGQGRVNVNVGLFRFGREGDVFQYEDVLQRFDSLGFRPGNVAELLAIGSTYPELQLKFPIVQMGTVWHHVERNGYRGLYLRRGKLERGLSVIWLDKGFYNYYRIIGIKKD